MSATGSPDNIAHSDAAAALIIDLIGACDLITSQNRPSDRPSSFAPPPWRTLPKPVVDHIQGLVRPSVLQAAPSRRPQVTRKVWSERPTSLLQRNRMVRH
jgi:hypothetical protein